MKYWASFCRRDVLNRDKGVQEKGLKVLRRSGICMGVLMGHPENPEKSTYQFGKPPGNLSVVATRSRTFSLALEKLGTGSIDVGIN